MFKFKSFRKLLVALAVCAASLGLNTSTWAASNTTRMHYVNQSGGWLVIEAAIRADQNDMNWMLGSTCLRNAVPPGGTCDLVASYGGSQLGVHSALVTVHIVNQQHEMTTKKIVVRAAI